MTGEELNLMELLLTVGLGLAVICIPLGIMERQERRWQARRDRDRPGAGHSTTPWPWEADVAWEDPPRIEGPAR